MGTPQSTNPGQDSGPCGETGGSLQKQNDRTWRADERPVDSVWRSGFVL